MIENVKCKIGKSLGAEHENGREKYDGGIGCSAGSFSEWIEPYQ